MSNSLQEERPPDGRKAVGSWAAMVGALILARMSNDSELSDEILSETRAWLAEQAQN